MLSTRRIVSTFCFSIPHGRSYAYLVPFHNSFGSLDKVPFLVIESVCLIFLPVAISQKILFIPFVRRPYNVTQQTFMDVEQPINICVIPSPAVLYIRLRSGVLCRTVGDVISPPGGRLRGDVVRGRLVRHAGSRIAGRSSWARETVDGVRFFKCLRRLAIPVGASTR